MLLLLRCNTRFILLKLTIIIFIHFSPNAFALGNSGRGNLRGSVCYNGLALYNVIIEVSRRYADLLHYPGTGFYLIDLPAGHVLLTVRAEDPIHGNFLKKISGITVIAGQTADCGMISLSENDRTGSRVIQNNLFTERHIAISFPAGSCSLDTRHISFTHALQEINKLEAIVATLKITGHLLEKKIMLTIYGLTTADNAGKDVALAAQRAAAVYYFIQNNYNFFNMPMLIKNGRRNAAENADVLVDFPDYDKFQKIIF